MTKSAFECKVCGVKLGRGEEGFNENDEFYDWQCATCQGHVCKGHLAMVNPPTCTDCAGD